MSIRFQAGNDLKFGTVRGVRLNESAIDFASAQEAGSDGLSDPEVLERMASEGRVLVSHARAAMPDRFGSHRWGCKHCSHKSACWE